LSTFVISEIVKSFNFFYTVLFQDYETANKIMETTKPVVQRHYARELKNLDLKLWNLKCVDIVMRENFHKE